MKTYLVIGFTNDGQPMWSQIRQSAQEKVNRMVFDILQMLQSAHTVTAWEAQLGMRNSDFGNHAATVSVPWD
jgi:hypothetical protein